MSDVITIPFPFILNTKPEEVYSELWVPGTRIEALPPDGDMGHFADGVGQIELTVVSRHKPPGRYPERVFYVRQWIDPEGRRFGKRALRVATAATFERRARGYYYPFELTEAARG